MPDLFCKMHCWETFPFWREEVDGLLHHDSVLKTEMLTAALLGWC